MAVGESRVVRFHADTRKVGAAMISESGDHFYGDNHRPFTQQGMWGLMRVLSDPTCPIRPLYGLDFIGRRARP